jgi:ADP-ribose pyrophosphatase
MARIVAKGKFIQLIDDESWEYADRPQSAGVASIVATYRGSLILVEQFRFSLRRDVIGLPGGLIERVPVGGTEESALSAARRELAEETGFAAARMRKAAQGALSPGTTSETLTLFIASGLKRLSHPTGDGDERLRLHLVDLKKLHGWLAARERRGALVDCMVYAGLYFLGRRRTSGPSRNPKRA